MNVVDSSGWFEYFADGRNAKFFEPPITKTKELVVPTVRLYEVFKRVSQQRGEAAALQAAATMQQGWIVDVTPSIALAAARASMTERLLMADSVMLATARALGATLWTQDADFADVAGVRYVAKKA